MLLLNGYLFVKDKSVENKTYWKCKDFENKCKSRTITIENEVKKEPIQHNHAGDPESVEAFRFMEDVKDKAKKKQSGCTTRNNFGCSVTSFASSSSCITYHK